MMLNIVRQNERTSHLEKGGLKEDLFLIAKQHLC